MTEPVIDPAVVATLAPAFGLVPDIVDQFDRATERWHRYRLPHQPPADLAHLHDPFLFARLWERLLAVVRRPTRELQLGGTRYVNVAGSCVVQVNADRTMQVHCWSGDMPGRPTLEPLSEWTVALQGMPFQDIWMRLLGRLAALEVERNAQDHGVAATPEQASRYGQWAFGVFWRQLRRHADLRQMRQAIARCLGYDADLVPLGGRIPRTTMNRGVVTVGAYNRVVRHQAAFQSLQLDAPNLLPVFGALCDSAHFPRKGEPLQRLRRYLTSGGFFTPSAWRMLAKSGPRLLQPLCRFYRGDPADATIEHLKLIVLLGLREVPPLWTVHALLGTWGDIGNRWTSYFGDLFFHAKSWHHVFNQLVDRQPTGELLAELDLIQRWMRTTGEMFTMTKAQRAAGWPWLVRSASAWAERQEREKRANVEHWPVPFDLAHIGDLEIKPLRNSLELWEEALAMRHCVDTFSEQCSTGKTVIASVREGGRRIATVEFRYRIQYWWLQQVKGFANAEVPEEMERQLKRFAQTIAMRQSITARVTHVVEDTAAAEVDDASPNNIEALKNELVAAVLDSVHGPEQDTLSQRVESWLEQLNDGGDLIYSMGGRIILNHQLEDWRQDLCTWLVCSYAASVLEDARCETLINADDATLLIQPHEAALIQDYFVKTVLESESTDEDKYGIWGAEEVKASDGRRVWAVYRISGYSFTMVDLSLLGMCANQTEILALLSSAGRFSGAETLSSKGGE